MIETETRLSGRFSDPHFRIAVDLISETGRTNFETELNFSVKSEEKSRKPSSLNQTGDGGLYSGYIGQFQLVEFYSNFLRIPPKDIATDFVFTRRNID